MVHSHHAYRPLVVHLTPIIVSIFFFPSLCRDRRLATWRRFYNGRLLKAPCRRLYRVTSSSTLLHPPHPPRTAATRSLRRPSSTNSSNLIPFSLRSLTFRLLFLSHFARSLRLLFLARRPRFLFRRPSPLCHASSPLRSLVGALLRIVSHWLCARLRRLFIYVETKSIEANNPNNPNNPKKIELNFGPWLPLSLSSCLPCLSQVSKPPLFIPKHSNMSVPASPCSRPPFRYRAPLACIDRSFLARN